MEHDATSPACTRGADEGRDGPAQDEASLAAAIAAAETSGDSEVRLSPAKPEPDQKKARRVKRRLGPRRMRLGPSPNETETKDDTQRLDEKSAGSEGGRAPKTLRPCRRRPRRPDRPTRGRLRRWRLLIQATHAQARPACLKQDCRTPLLSDHKRIVSFPFGHSGRARRRGITRGPTRTRLRAPHL